MAEILMKAGSFIAIIILGYVLRRISFPEVIYRY